jgi:hypothetical protein
LTQRDCVISPGQREASVEAEEGRERLTQSHSETRRVDAVAEGVVFASAGIAQSLEAQSFSCWGIGIYRQFKGAKLLGYCGQNNT